MKTYVPPALEESEEDMSAPKKKRRKKKDPEAPKKPLTGDRLAMDYPVVS
jgi:hypothetical protein